jgi:hypothetical protein
MSDGDWKIVKDFIDVGYDQTTAGGRAKAIAKGVNDEHLRRKIEILNVPWRSANGRDPQR